MPRGGTRGEDGIRNGGDATGLLGTDGARLPIGALATPTDGHVLTYDSGTATIRLEAAAGGGIGGSTGATDNALLRANGTGGATLQDSGITVADAASGVAEMTSARLVRGQRVISSSPDTQLVSDDTLYFSAATTVDLLTSVTTGREFLYVCTAAATLTLDPGGTDTIDGGSAGVALAIPCAAGQAVRLIRSGSGAWRAVLPGVINGLQIVGVSGAPVMRLGVWTGNTFRQVGGDIAVTSSADTNAFGATWSGADLTVNAATAVAGNNDSTAQRWSFQLPVTIPSTTRSMTLGVSVSSFSEGARTASSVSSVGVSVGTSATAAVRTVAMIRPGSGTSYNVGTIGGSGTFSTLSGSATNIGVTGTSTVGDTVNGDTLMVRYLTGNDPTGCASISSAGNPGATLPTWVSVYVQVTGANTLTTWTLTGLTLDVRW